MAARSKFELPDGPIVMFVGRLEPEKALDELQEMFSRQPCILLAASASNAASAGDPDALERLAGNPDWWQRFLDWEEELAQEPGALDGGTHTIFAVQRS